MSGPPAELVFQDLPIFVFGGAPSCAGCSRVTDASAARMPADASERTFDIALTFDGAVVVSDRFREACETLPGCRFTPIDDSAREWLLDAEPIVQLEPFDSHVQRGPLCDTCGEPRYVTRSGPLVLEPGELLPVGFSQSDVAFGDTADFGREQPIRLRPSLFVDRSTLRDLKQASLLGVHTVVQP